MLESLLQHREQVGRAERLEEKVQRASVMEKLQVGTMAGLAALFEGEDLDRLLGPQAARRKPV